MTDLQALVDESAAHDWVGETADRLAAAIEVYVVQAVPSRVERVLGQDEARQRARVLAWERCLRLAGDPPPAGLGWGYLANHVRWRLADAVRAELLRHDRHPSRSEIPERQAPEVVRPLGRRLEMLAVELSACGIELGTASRWLRAAGEGPRFERAAIAARLVEVGAGQQQAKALAWLLRGGPRFESVLSRLARGESAGHVFDDPRVRAQVLRMTDPADDRTAQLRAAGLRAA